MAAMDSPVQLSAIVRPVPKSMLHCELTHLQRNPIDSNRAQQQHASYVAAIAKHLGEANVHFAADAPSECADSVFVEDTMIALDELAIATRPGAKSRRPEVKGMVETMLRLRPSLDVRQICAPDTIDGGDVMVAVHPGHGGRVILIGISSRTTEGAARQVAEIVSPFEGKYTVATTTVSGALHLKSGVTVLKEGVFLVNPDMVSVSTLADIFGRNAQFVTVDHSEPGAANCLALGGDTNAVIFPAEFPKTLARISAAAPELTVEVCENDELAKAEGAVTCCSVIFTRELGGTSAGVPFAPASKDQDVAESPTSAEKIVSSYVTVSPSASASSSADADASVTQVVPPVHRASYGIPIVLPEWHFPSHIRPGGKYLTLVGRSRAADCSGFCIPELRLALDAGIKVYPGRPSHVFMTHTHGDHCRQLMCFLSRQVKPEFFAPLPSAPFVDHFCKAFQELNASANFSSERPLEVDHITRAVQGGDVLPLLLNKQYWQLNVFNLDHSVPTVGYGFSHKRRALRAEFQGLPGAEIAARRRAGEEVTDELIEPVFAYVLDTTPKCYIANPSLLTYPVIVTECTFISDQHRAEADRTRHTLWADLRDIVRSNQQIVFVLTHFSLRYTSAEIRRHFKIENLPNVVLMLHDDARGESTNELQSSDAQLHVPFQLRPGVALSSIGDDANDS